ncbi:MAG: ABC transporter permease, partial [Pseudomonadota bacterium]
MTPIAKDARRSFLAQVRYVMSENIVTLGAFLLFLMLVLFALFGNAIAPYNPIGSDATVALS